MGGVRISPWSRRAVTNSKERRRKTELQGGAPADGTEAWLALDFAHHICSQGLWLNILGVLVLPQEDVRWWLTDPHGRA